MTELKLAKIITIVREWPGRTKLFIDGEEFPYHISADRPISVHVSANDIGKVDLTLMAERVVVDDNMFPSVSASESDAELEADPE